MKKQSSEERSVEQLAQSEFFQRVSDICTQVNSVTEARELLEISLKKILELFHATRGSIFILKDNGKDLTLKIARGLAVGEEEQMVKRMGEGVVGKVAANKKPIFVDDISNDKRFANYKSEGKYRTPSFICAPLLIKDQLIGVINIADKISGQRFSKNELQLLDFLSSQIALNYRRIELYKKFSNILKESEHLKDKLGKSSQEASHLKKQIILHEKLATIGKLAGGIAHEFNNPLDGVMRYTNLCLEHVKEDEVVRGYLLEIKNGLNRMAGIVRSLLACSRSTHPTMQKINPNLAVEQVVQALHPEITLRNITIDLQLKKNLQEITDLGLERILTNLARNAIDSIENGGIICIVTDCDDEFIVFEVKDTGCGIEEDKVEAIFEPFYTTKDIEKGCGLGLTIVSEIVKSYNGQINVESTKNKGTTFTILLPLETNSE